MDAEGVRPKAMTAAATTNGGLLGLIGKATFSGADSSTHAMAIDIEGRFNNKIEGKA